jgi:hypothetical protein
MRGQHFTLGAKQDSFHTRCAKIDPDVHSDDSLTKLPGSIVRPGVRVGRLLIKQIVIDQVFQQFLMTALVLWRQAMLFSVLRDFRQR